jgi:(p)ppGpp synthase/HD superfamily hydrolase
LETLEKAILIAVNAHQGQNDRYGASYILHPLRVMMRLETEKEMTVAVLHDVVEKSDWTLQGLRDEGFDGDILEAVDLLTRRESQNYQDYINKLKGNPLARKIKIADIEDNMNPKRMGSLTEKDGEKLSRLRKAWHILTDIDE